MNKADAIRAILTELEAELQTLVASTSAALDEATSEHSKAENKYDTRSLEASYLAGAQTERLLALKQRIAFYQVLSPADLPSDTPARLGTLLQIEEEDTQWWCFVAPEGGKRIRCGGEEIILVSPQSALGRSLLGAREDDEVLVKTPKGDRHLVLCSIR